MPKFSILATKRIELRGTVYAQTLDEAKSKVKDYWYVYDTPGNSVTAGTAEKGGAMPILSEYQDPIRIFHIQKENEQEIS